MDNYCLRANSFGVGGRLSEEEGKMKCPLCKGNMLSGKTNLPYELDREKIIVVRDVPALVCDQCGDAFVEIDILRKVEEVITMAEQNGITMAFVEYEKAA